MSLMPEQRRKQQAATAELLTPGKLCAQTDLTRGALRVYERSGLIRAKQRTSAGYRLFAPDSVERIHAIRVAKSVGFTLAEIRDILRLIDSENFSRARMRMLLKQRLDVIDARIEQLRALRRVLAAAVNNPDTLVDPECNLLLGFESSTPTNGKLRSR